MVDCIVINCILADVVDVAVACQSRLGGKQSMSEPKENVRKKRNGYPLAIKLEQIQANDCQG